MTTLPDKPDSVAALRLPDGRRGVRARYPNGDPEVNGMGTIPSGWVTEPTTCTATSNIPLDHCSRISQLYTTPHVRLVIVLCWRPYNRHFE